MTQSSFNNPELSRWHTQAGMYEGPFAKITNNAIGPLLDSFGVLHQKRLLDVSCGSGHLSGTISELGALCEGVDISSAMVQLAGKNYPKVKFKEGNPEALPYENSQFHAVVCSFGLLNLEHPERAIYKAWRVLKSGGRYSYAAWCGPEQGGEYFGLIANTLMKFETLARSSQLLHSVFMLADEDHAKKALRQAGFVNPIIRRVLLKWHPSNPEDLLEPLQKSTINLTKILETQAPEIHNRILQEIIEEGQKRQVINGLKFSIPFVIASAEKK